MDQTPRRRSRLLACGAALALLPALAPPAYAADEVKLDQTKKTFIVQMKGDPVATYDGGVQGIPATKPAAGKKVNAKSGNAKKLEAHMRNEQRKALRDAKVKESAKKHEYTVAFNGFTAELTESEAAVLKKSPGVPTAASPPPAGFSWGPLPGVTPMKTLSADVRKKDGGGAVSSPSLSSSWVTEGFGAKK